MLPSVSEILIFLGSTLRSVGRELQLADERLVRHRHHPVLPPQHDVFVADRIAEFGARLHQSFGPAGAIVDPPGFLAERRVDGADDVGVFGNVSRNTTYRPRMRLIGYSDNSAQRGIVSGTTPAM